MARKRQRTERTTSERSIIKLCAFVGIFLSAVMFVVGAILRACKTGSMVADILTLIAQLALLVAVAFPAYHYVRGTHNRTAWTIVYWICLFLYVFGVVFNVISIYFI